MDSGKTVGVGIIGAKFLAETRARCYRSLGPLGARIVAVAASTEDSAASYAAQHNVPHAFGDYRQLLQLREVDVVDLCIPNSLHRQVAEAAAAAGKHIICTKPLTAYTGQDLGGDPDEEAVSRQDRRRMLEVAVQDAQAMVDSARRHRVQLMYGENWIFSPSIRKAMSLIESAGGHILEMRGGECHSGSHSPYSKAWKHTGGGALLRLGAHPIGAMLHLKSREGLARDGRPIRAVSVMAETADLTKRPGLGRGADSGIVTGWKDVETWASAIIGFEDGSKGIVWAADTVLGGMESRLQVLASNAHIKCNLSPHDLVRAFAPNERVFAGEAIQEKLETPAGWSTPLPDEDWSSGHVDMCREFITAVAEGRPAQSQGELGLEVIRVIYSAYCSAAEGRRATIDR